MVPYANHFLRLTLYFIRYCPWLYEILLSHFITKGRLKLDRETTQFTILDFCTFSTRSKLNLNTNNTKSITVNKIHMGKTNI